MLSLFFLGHKIGWRKAKRFKSSVPLDKFTSLENSLKEQNNSLPKVNTMNSCSIGNASNLLSLNSNSRR